MTTHTLDTSLDTAAAAPLRQELLARLELRQPMLMDGAGVVRVGQACLQVLASARAAAAKHSVPFAVTNPSHALSEMAALAGLATVLEPIG